MKYIEFNVDQTSQYYIKNQDYLQEVQESANKMSKLSEKMNSTEAWKTKLKANPNIEHEFTDYVLDVLPQGYIEEFYKD